MLALLFLAACSHDGGFKLPGVYRIDIQQGSVIEQDMLPRLKPGMDKEQVKFIMGTPAIVDPFHPDRWEYVYTYSKGGAPRKQRHVTLRFQDGKLAHLEGDVVPGEERPETPANKPARVVEVPQGSRKKPNMFSKILDAIKGSGEGPAPSMRPENEPLDGTVPATPADLPAPPGALGDQSGG